MITIPHTLSPKQQLRFEAENGVLKAIADNYLQLMHHILQEDLQCLLQEKEPDLFLIKDYQSKIQTVLQWGRPDDDSFYSYLQEYFCLDNTPVYMWRISYKELLGFIKNDYLYKGESWYRFSNDPEGKYWFINFRGKPDSIQQKNIQMLLQQSQQNENIQKQKRSIFQRWNSLLFS